MCKRGGFHQKSPASTNRHAGDLIFWGVPTMTGKQAFCLAVSVQLAIAAVLAFWGGEWRDGVVILAGAAVNGVMAV